MNVESLIESAPLILTEAAVIEPMTQDPRLEMHQQLFNAPLIYKSEGRQAFYDLYKNYLDVALQADLPMMIFSPTWRAGRDRIRAARIKRLLNHDAVVFMRELRDILAPVQHHVFVGGLIGSKEDCYRPDLAPDEHSAERYHAWQVQQLAEAGVDFQLAATLPNVAEARGVARALRETGQPYFISFVINQKGHVLDGTKLEDAIDTIDRAAGQHPPFGYMVNCAYPSFLDMTALPQGARERFMGYQANASSKPHQDLDGSHMRQMEDIDDWAARMARLHRQWGLKILGGCCGTGSDHLQRLVAKIRRPLS